MLGVLRQAVIKSPLEKNHCGSQTENCCPVIHTAFEYRFLNVNNLRYTLASTEIQVKLLWSGGKAENIEDICDTRLENCLLVCNF